MQSIIVTCYNEGLYVASSLRAVLDRTKTPIEVLVVDDASTDNTAEAVQSVPGVRLIKQEKRSGVAQGRNLAAGLSKGEILQTLDAHIWPYDGALDLLFEAAGKHDAVIGSATVFVSVHPKKVGNDWQGAIDGADTRPIERAAGLSYCRRKNWFYFCVERYIDTPLPRRTACYAPGLTVRRELFDRIGGWARLPGKWSSNDIAWALKCWFMDVPILSQWQAKLIHAQKTTKSHATPGWEQTLNKAYAAYLCFDDETFEGFWKPGLTKRLAWDSRIDGILASPETQKERAGFRKHKVRTDGEFMESFIVPSLRSAGLSTDWRALWVA